MKEFVHIHVHSEYSLLDGYATPSAIVRRAAELDMDSIALTDHGVLYGAIEFYEAAKKAGIKPIIGVEAYVAVGRHTERSPHHRTPSRGHAYHLLLLAKDYRGYQNLVKLITRAHVEGFYYKPRIDHEILAEHKEGLIATSACLAGEISEHLQHGQRNKALEIAAWYRDLLGPDNYYLELQLHPTLGQLAPINDELVRIGRELGIPLVATNDVHFIHREDAPSQQLIRALGYNITIQELKQKEPELDDSYYLKSGEEMWELFKRYGPEPLENTRAIAERCALHLDFGRVKLPTFELPEGHDAASYLRLLCEEGLMRRFDGHPPQEYRNRLAYELDVINQTGFPDYLLIVWDYVRFAREQKIPCLPRGSAGASLVLYCLGITDVDPVAHRLLFERFLSPERLEMPDIDTDFADNRRHEIIEYIANKYGRENTAQIITYGTLGAKAAIRDMGRVLNIPLPEVDRITRLIPNLPVGITIEQALERVPELKRIYTSDELLRDLIDKARLIEGRIRSVGTHACGLVVSHAPLDTIVPLQQTRDQTALMAAYEGPALAKIGLLKMDILGLTNLSIVAEALKYIEQSTHRSMTLADIPTVEAPLPDGSSNGVERTFASLSEGNTTNVFQFESAGMTRYLKELKPTRVEDLFAMVALYRPGPIEQIPTYIRNKNNPEAITYLHPILEPILSDTYGVIVYQEQIMELLQKIAGYTLGQAYIVLKAIGKKNRDLMAKEEPRFKEGCLRNGLSQEQADALWSLIQPFAGYSFNRPHSTLYGLLSYQTAYLKVNYPTEYMAAVLTAAAGNSIEEVAKSVAECGRLGVKVLPPDVNRSGYGFTIEVLHHPQAKQERAIRFGLSAIKNIGSGPIEAILTARQEGGNFVSLEDFCARVDRNALNRRVLESLIKSGAMDALAENRHQLMDILDRALAAGLAAQKARDVGQSSLFDAFSSSQADSFRVQPIPLPDIKEDASKIRQKLQWEKEVLGLYISSHPVMQALEKLDRSGTLPLDQLHSRSSAGKPAMFLGMLREVRRITTKKGKPMLVGILEDEGGSVDVVAFSEVLEHYADMLQEGSVVKVEAKIDRRRDTIQLIIGKCLPVNQLTSASETRDDAQASDARATGGVLDEGMDDIPGTILDFHGIDELDEPDTVDPINGLDHSARANALDDRGKDDHHRAADDQVQGYTTKLGGEGHASKLGGEGEVRGETTEKHSIVYHGGESMKSDGALPESNPIGYIPHRPRVHLSGNGPSDPNKQYDVQSTAGKNSNHNGRAGNPGNGKGFAVTRPPSTGYIPHAATEGHKRVLRLHLTRSHDEEADVRQLQCLDEILRSHLGSEEILLCIPNEHGNIVLRPNYTVQISEDLLEKLESVSLVKDVVLSQE